MSAFVDTVPCNTEEQLLTDSLRNCSISSASTAIDIDGQLVSADILVALLDRPGEMKELVMRNKPFYEMLEHFITETQGPQAWQHFLDILYRPRERLPDRIWVNQISHYLAGNPVFLNTFKESVGYDDDEDETAVTTPPFKQQTNPLPPRKLSTSRSSGSVSTVSSFSNNGGGHHTRRRRSSRRLSSMGSIPTLQDTEDYFHFEEIPKDPEGMFVSEDQFYNENRPYSSHFEPLRRRRSSCHSIQAEPHPTFVDFKIDEVDEANIDVDCGDEGAESDHLAELLDQDSDSDDEDDYSSSNKEVQQTSERRESANKHGRQIAQAADIMDILRLRDFPEFQSTLPQTHASFFAKANRLMSLAPSSRRLSAAMRRNSIFEDSMPSSPVTELDEPHVQICSDDDGYNRDSSSLERLICCTRRQQPDDIAWLNGITEKLAGWPELLDALQEIVQENVMP